ncbi:MAG TPA: C4-type zinc ribbon domain-containing protein [Paludibacteraceae bacterium]|nr:C4-type zinc ribbon domain-containing protein [Paludibacteraceae bacterium]HQB69101.1 C4-type zinc ribbon domain-containing protein [Paludibacteraceae bacterium]HRS67537.1 C4-type zinc ribbon domain-containing protein [Paludibacteraceae bacterium]
MAEQKTAEVKEISVEERLVALYELQTVVSEIDKIKTLRGELPLEVQDLEDEIAGLQTRIDKYNTDIVDMDKAIEAEKIKIEEARAKIAKNTEQQNNVRNNREFDALSKEIEFQSLEIELSEKRIREYSTDVKVKHEEVEVANKQCSERQFDLTQKKAELDEIVAETRQEEERLREKVKELEALIDPRLLTAFKRIRKNARNGLAVVSVERDACGGCFNKIPPQRQMDIRMRKKIIVCEYCGRILVDKELASAE